jgi:uncharacterized protein
MKKKSGSVSVLGLVVLGLVATLISGCRSDALRTAVSPQARYRQVEVMTILSGPEQSLFVVLKSLDEQWLLPISIGPAEAQAIALELQKMQPPRPMTHDLAKTLVETLGGKVERVEVTEMQDSIFRAAILVRRERDVFRVDARPSDAMALALRSGAPIYVAEGILTTAGVAASEKEGGAARPASLEEHIGLWFQELSPELAGHFGFEGGGGVLVSRVASGSAAEAAGLAAGDIIVRVDGQQIDSPQGLAGALRAMPPSSRHTVELVREGALQEISLQMPEGELPAPGQKVMAKLEDKPKVEL